MNSKFDRDNQHDMVTSRENGGRIFSGIIWKMAEKFGGQFVSFFAQIILARILSPEDYGVIAIITVFVALSDVFILQGFTTALIQKKTISQTDLSSVFFANILLSIVLYVILYLSSGWIARFYNIAIVEEVTKVLALNIIIGAFSSVHNAVLSRELDFKKSFYRNISSILVYGTVAITLAYLGYGVWSLVYARLVGSFVGSLVLCLTVKWKPSLKFSVKTLIGLFSYSSKILGSNLLNTLFHQINSVYIGKFHTATDLGYFQRGRQIPELIMTSIDGSLSEVMYPALSSMQDNLDKLKNTMRNSLKSSFFIVSPLLVFLGVVAEPLTILLLTEKWLGSVNVMRLTCVICLFWPLSIRMHALNAIGKSGTTFKLSLISQCITLLILSCTVKYGIIIMLWGNVVGNVFYLFYSSYYVKRYIGYTLLDMFSDIKITLMSSLVMGIIIYFIGLINVPILFSLIIQAVVAVLVYLGIEYKYKDQGLQLFMGAIKKIINKFTMYSDK